MKNFIIGFFVGIILTFIISIISDVIQQHKFDNLGVLYEVKIINDYINVRKNPTTGSDRIYEVLEGETYQVIGEYNDNPYYKWYQIKISERRTGWIASDRKEAWVNVVEE